MEGEAQVEADVEVDVEVSSPVEEEDVEVEVGTDDHQVPNLTVCSLCTAQFVDLDNDEPLTPEEGRDGVAAAGSPVERESWKVLVFRALCEHLNVGEIFASILERNILDGVMKAFRLCMECKTYGWQLVVLNQKLATVHTEIEELTNAFRKIIAIATSTPAMRVINSESCLELDGDGPGCIQEFVRKVTENVILPEPPPPLEDDTQLCAPPDGNQEPDEDEGQGVGEDVVPVPDSTSEIILFSEDGALNFDVQEEEENITYTTYQFPGDLNFVSESSASNCNNLTGNGDPHWVGVGGLSFNTSGEDQGQQGHGHDQMQYLDDDVDVGVQEYIEIPAEGEGLVVESGLSSPSPPYSPLSVGGVDMNLEDVEVEEGEDDDNPPDGKSRLEMEEAIGILRPIREVQEPPLPYYNPMNDNLFTLKLEPPFCSPVEKEKKKTHKKGAKSLLSRGHCRTRKKSAAVLEAEIEAALQAIAPKSELVEEVSVKNVVDVGVDLLQTTIKEKRRYRTRNKALSVITHPPEEKIKKPVGRPKKNPEAAVVVQQKLKLFKSGRPKLPKIRIGKKILASLPDIEVEGYETLCRMGIKFTRAVVKLHRCSVSEIGESSNSLNSTTSSASQQQQQLPKVRECYVRVHHDDLFDKIVSVRVPLYKASPKKKTKSRTPSKASASLTSTSQSSSDTTLKSKDSGRRKRRRRISSDDEDEDSDPKSSRRSISLKNEGQGQVLQEKVQEVEEDVEMETETEIPQQLSPNSRVGNDVDLLFNDDGDIDIYFDAEGPSEIQGSQDNPEASSILVSPPQDNPVLVLHGVDGDNHFDLNLDNSPSPDDSQKTIACELRIKPQISTEGGDDDQDEPPQLSQEEPVGGGEGSSTPPSPPVGVDVEQEEISAPLLLPFNHISSQPLSIK